VLTDREVTKRTLIVARMRPDDAPAVAQIFGESDAGELPHLVGVNRRDLFYFHGLYFHLVESRHDLDTALSSVRSGPLFADVNSKLAKYVSAFDPSTWRTPRDAMAQPFYSWVADQGPNTAR
jgi:cyclase